jgi:hypothetical protein
MAVPNTTTFSLLDVIAEIPGTQNSLQDCIDDHIASGLDPLYGSTPVTSLLEFRNYTHTITYYSLTGCGVPNTWTTLVPPIANQRYIDPTGAPDYYYWNGTTSTSTQTVNGSLQLVTSQTFCP